MIRLVVGAKHTRWPGWISTDRGDLDIRRVEDWRRSFEPGTVDAILCEHVLEHMPAAEALSALKNFHQFLKRGGYARIAVPDALNPDPAYQEHSRPGARGHLLDAFFLFGPGEPHHHEHYSLESLSALIREAGLLPKPLEWFDEAGQFHRVDWDMACGEVRRSKYHWYSTGLRWLTGIEYLSLIVDAVKT